MIALIFYYIFSACFMLGWTLQNECNFGIRLIGTILAMILAPILLPINLGGYIRKKGEL